MDARLPTGHQQTFVGKQYVCIYIYIANHQNPNFKNHDITQLFYHRMHLSIQNSMWHEGFTSTPRGLIASPAQLSLAKHFLRPGFGWGNVKVKTNDMTFPLICVSLKIYWRYTVTTIYGGDIDQFEERTVNCSTRITRRMVDRYRLVCDWKVSAPPA